MSYLAALLRKHLHLHLTEDTPAKMSRIRDQGHRRYLH